MTGRDDTRFMRRALALAARGLGETNPNPVVGCVVVRDGRVVGEGYHARAGGPHAEVLALAAAGARARGATLYATLEPCAHHGRTPPCAPHVVAAGVRRVVVATRDPHPLVAGLGLRLLQRAGVAVATGVLEAQARLLNERFLTAARRGRPFVLLKVAMTLDGVLATASGESRWITSPAQRAAARALRRLHDAVLVGVGTALADDPLLLPRPRVRRPFNRIVLDSRLRLPPGGRLARSAHRSPVWAVTVPGAAAARRRRLEAAGVRVLVVSAERGRVALAPLVERLRREGLTSLMVEGGSEVLGAFLAARLVDQVALFRAPLLLGGRGARPAFGGEDPLRLAAALRLTRRSPLLGRLPDPPPPPGRPPEALCEFWYPDR